MHTHTSRRAAYDPRYIHAHLKELRTICDAYTHCGAVCRATRTLFKLYLVPQTLVIPLRFLGIIIFFFDDDVRTCGTLNTTASSKLRTSETRKKNAVIGMPTAFERKAMLDPNLFDGTAFRDQCSTTRLSLFIIFICLFIRYFYL